MRLYCVTGRLEAWLYHAPIGLFTKCVCHGYHQAKQPNVFHAAAAAATVTTVTADRRALHMHDS